MASLSIILSCWQICNGWLFKATRKSGSKSAVKLIVVYLTADNDYELGGATPLRSGGPRAQASSSCNSISSGGSLHDAARAAGQSQALHRFYDTPLVPRANSEFKSTVKAQTI
jgi:hypothetical protein